MLKLKQTTQCLIASVFVASPLVAQSATMASAQFLHLSAGGGTVGNFSDVTGSIGGGTWSVASPSPFFGSNWNAHSGTTFGPGSYTFDTIEGGVYTGVVVGAGQVGGHILFDWIVVDTDIINVWDVTTVGGITTYTSTPVDTGSLTDPYGIAGLAAIDGATPGSHRNFNFTITAVPIPSAVWLFGSGLLGLVGVARRKKRRD